MAEVFEPESFNVNIQILIFEFHKTRSILIDKVVFVIFLFAEL